MKKTSRVEKMQQYLDYLFPDPQCELIYHSDYELLIAVVLSAQSTDKRVNSVTPILFQKYPTLKALKEASLEDLENILRPIGSYHKKASYIKEIARIIVDDYQGSMPCDRKILESFPGVGRKTVNVVFSEYYHIPAFAVDTHVERVSKRLGLAKEQDNVLTIEEKLKKAFPKEEWGRRHLQMVLFGRYYCKAIKPDCSSCKLKEICFYHTKKKK
ncbi:MAG TPA: endonuclease III [Candidatus Onthousia faecigallinarum]|nr:endonuclease III [Candidatus Onthousia faecigallinarum]